ncbi:MAG: protein phosphatase 2C domain-containing protein [Blastocatellia bacterium]|nr:protein phosphatase 2C domain-containing protein [Blastocatellia bacterium]
MVSDISNRILVTTAGLTDEGTRRSVNEDAFLVGDLSKANWSNSAAVQQFQMDDAGLLLAVSDGSGSWEGVSRCPVMLDFFWKQVRKLFTPQDVLSTLRLALEKTSFEFYQRFAAQEHPDFLGGTLTALLFHRRFAYAVHVGDSRLYLLRSNEFRQILKDQTLAQSIIDQGQRRPEDIAACHFKNVILQAVGATEYIKVSLGQMALRQGDRFLLCSDGLWEETPDAAMKSYLAEASDVGAACSSLVQHAIGQSGTDNITAVVAEVTGEDLPLPQDGETIEQTIWVRWE